MPSAFLADSKKTLHYTEFKKASASWTITWLKTQAKVELIIIFLKKGDVFCAILDKYITFVNE